MASIFGEPPIRPEDLFGNLTLSIPIELKRLGPPDSEKKWTIAVNAALCRLSQERSFDPYCKDQLAGEWLLDMVWLRGQTGIGLVAECEWIMKGRAISDDFEKLLYFKSPLKLFIFQARRDEQSFDFRQTIQRLMDQFAHHVEGEQYVLFEVRGQHANGYTYTVPSTGKVPPVAFTEIDGSPRKWEW
jgi:hypothetical protein